MKSSTHADTETNKTCVGRRDAESPFFVLRANKATVSFWCLSTLAVSSVEFGTGEERIVEWKFKAEFEVLDVKGTTWVAGPFENILQAPVGQSDASVP
ncbi:hypothetical protein V496_05351 [Pseudogymnoascus sp. VKM F-4515 (FW-2607)]|nr:hypothetical protein V496_05351 [Pseudogymnoascus sp. VKM F-4515 (FW-2607)]KFY78759.1 hypothetical protein V498_09055 [Pseudogymnoascus sp. VKM F-4517 (FW-2822)]